MVVNEYFLIPIHKYTNYFQKKQFFFIFFWIILIYLYNHYTHVQRQIDITDIMAAIGLCVCLLSSCGHICKFNKKKHTQMVYNYYNPKDNQTYELELHRLPYISITKKQAVEMCKILSPDEMANVISTFIKCIYSDKCDTTCLDNLNRVERCTIDTMFEQLCRINMQYFKKLKNLKNVNYDLK